MKRLLLGALALMGAGALVAAEAGKHPFVSGIYPHLTMFNDEGECGTGAVVPWAGSLWAVTYAPHKPDGSSDKLYEIKPDLTQTIRPETARADDYILEKHFFRKHGPEAYYGQPKNTDIEK